MKFKKLIALFLIMLCVISGAIVGTAVATDETTENTPSIETVEVVK